MVEDAIDEDTFLVSIAQANSVLGAISDVHAIASVCKSIKSFSILIQLRVSVT